MFATSHNVHLQVIINLIEAGANPNHTDADGNHIFSLFFKFRSANCINLSKKCYVIVKFFYNKTSNKFRVHV